ncbi:glutamate--cysteine ligase [Aurantivibrio plasticivorans]
MGIEVDRTEFSAEDYRAFGKRVRDNLYVLERLLAKPNFGAGPTTFGAELELYLIDNNGHPLLLNQDIQNQLQDPQLTLELNRYNLEYNFSPYAISDNCLAKTEAEALSVLKRINECAQQWGGSAIPVGILPTLQAADTGYHVMTKTKRYEALTKQLSEIRGGPFTIDIQGSEHLNHSMQDVTLEGACTSFQIHLRVAPERFADTYNALQLVTPLALALGANSPILFGHRLWHESRIPLFKQSIDCRRPDPAHPTPARVNYGHSWLRHGASELFAESIYLYQPILPLISTEDPLEIYNQGGVPSLHELRLQQGSVWLWNRPVFDPADEGHLRIEMRALPAGPTIVDMMANAALLIGLTEMQRIGINEKLPAIPFEYCIKNFHRAAEHGLNAELIWPDIKQNKLTYRPVTEILKDLLPKLSEHLTAIGFLHADFDRLLGVIDERLQARQNGAQWQLNKLRQLEQQLSRPAALVAMIQEYRENSAANIPVAQWK